MELSKKYYSYGEIKGNIILNNLSKVERDAVSTLGFVINDNKVKIPVKKLADSLMIDDLDLLKELVEKILGEKLVSKKESKAKNQNADKELLEAYILKLKNKNLIKYIKENPGILKLSITENLIKILNNLDNSNYKTLGNYSAEFTGDPHLLDINSPCYRQLIKYLKFQRTIEIEIDLEEEKELLLGVGMITNPLNTYITVYGFRGETKAGRESLILKSALEEKEDVNLNLANIMKFEKINSVNPKVLILENPNAYIAVRKLIEATNDKISLICTSGHLNQSAYMFLDKLVQSKTEIYYSGDIDPEGILIAQRVKKRFPQIKLIAFELGIYKKYKSDIKIKKSSLSKLSKVKLNLGIDYELLSCLEKNKQPAYQELFYKEIIDIVLRNIY